jgi:hypothetical protein
MVRVHGRQNLKPFLWQIFLFETQTNYKLNFHNRKGSDNSDFHIVGIITFFILLLKPGDLVVEDSLCLITWYFSFVLEACSM